MSKDETRFGDKEALLFHSSGRPGKIEITPTKPMATQRDLSLAYSPGVAVPVIAISKDPAAAYDYTTKGNLVAVVSNGTAILGLGNLGALAAKAWAQEPHAIYKLVDVFRIHLQIDRVHIGESLEQNCFSLHYWFGGERPEIA